MLLRLSGGAVVWARVRLELLPLLCRGRGKLGFLVLLTSQGTLAESALIGQETRFVQVPNRHRRVKSITKMKCQTKSVVTK